MQVTN